MNSTVDAKEIFFAALEQKSPQNLASYLDKACGTNAELREQVGRLLRAHEQAGLFLGGSSPDQATIDQAPSERPGTQIGPYKLLQQIGEGGFGVVFMAEQLEPVRRKVAVKVIKPGMDTRQVIARFEAERQALAVMDHPNIAKVLDAGTVGGGIDLQPAEVLAGRMPTLPGRPYFVMELVRGIPITQFCDENQLPIRQRLNLFASVCLAIQHAHTKGIIHRDIKPTNVLVTQQDGAPMVKVIDFGIAKAMGAQLTEKTLFTEFAQMIGTPLYMSPEQAAMSSGDIDTRSDIYSLGVLLYELLTGSTPVSKEQLKQAAFDEIRRIIREDEPQKPSTRISGSDTLPSIAAQRHIEPARLSRLVRGELDWIVMKALEKDRNRRYETAGSLAMDVNRYLADGPVLAHPPSKWYKVRKLAWRHKGACLAASLVSMLLLLTLGNLAFSNARIRQEQALTHAEKVRAVRAQRLAEKHAAKERLELENLKAANAALEQGRWYVAQQRWNDADISFTKAVELRPDHAAAWVERGDLFALLGLWDLARADFDREIELREPDASARWYRLALLRLYLGDSEGYRSACRRMGEHFRGTPNIEFVAEVLRTMVLSADPEMEIDAILDLANRFNYVANGTWYEQYVVGIAQYRAGHFQEAVDHLQASLRGQPEWEVRALSYPVLAMAQHRLERSAEAQAALQSAAEAIERWTQDRYRLPEGVLWVNHFGATARWPIAWWDWVEFQIYLREAKLLIEGSPAPEDPRLTVLRARAFAGMRKNFTADIEYVAALKRMPDDRQVRVEAHRSAAYSAIGREQWQRACDEFSKAIGLMPDDPALWRYQAVAALAAGDAETYRQTCSAMLKRFGDRPVQRTAYQMVWTCAMTENRAADAESLLALARIASPSHYVGGEVHLAALYRAGKYDEAVAFFAKMTSTFRPTAWEWAFLAMSHHQLGHASEARRCLAEAKAWIDAANRQTEVDLSSVLPAWTAWHGPIAYPLLLREAEELLETGPGLTGQESGARDQESEIRSREKSKKRSDRSSTCAGINPPERKQKRLVRP